MDLDLKAIAPRADGKYSPLLHKYLRREKIRRGDKAPTKQRHDRCIHPSGPHPMNEFCQWKTAKREGAA